MSWCRSALKSERPMSPRVPLARALTRQCWTRETIMGGVATRHRVCSLAAQSDRQCHPAVSCAGLVGLLANQPVDGVVGIAGHGIEAAVVADIDDLVQSIPGQVERPTGGAVESVVRRIDRLAGWHGLARFGAYPCATHKRHSVVNPQVVKTSFGSAVPIAQSRVARPEVAGSRSDKTPHRVRPIWVNCSNRSGVDSCLTTGRGIAACWHKVLHLVPAAPRQQVGRATLLSTSRLSANNPISLPALGATLRERYWHVC